MTGFGSSSIPNDRSRQRNSELLQQAVKLHQSGNASEAEKYYIKYMKVEPGDPSSYVNLGVLYKNLGRLKEASLMNLKAIEISPDFQQAYSNHANLLQLQGDFRSALFYAEKAVELDVSSAASFLNLGVILKDLNEFDKSFDALRKAISINSEFAQAHCHMGLLLAQHLYHREARYHLEYALKLNPSDLLSLKGLGHLLFSIGCFQDALSCLRRSEGSLQFNLKSGISFCAS